MTRNHAGRGFDYRPLRDNWYQEGWYSSRTCIDALKDGAADHGDVPVVFASAEAETIATVAEIHSASLGVAATLQRLGVAAGDSVAVQLTNGLECAIAYQAVLLCGAVLVPIVHIYGPKEVGFILTDSGAKVLIMLAGFRSTSYLDRICEYERLAELRHIVVVGGDERGACYMKWLDLVCGAGDYAEPSSASDDACVLLYTSGTTSAPKGVQHSHNSMLAEQTTLPDLIAGEPHDVQLVTFPPGHVAGVSCMLRALMSGSRTVFLDTWDPEKAADLIDRFGVTATAGTPFHLDGLLRVSEARRKTATLREFLIGAATVTEEQGRRAQAAGITTYRCYGLSEHPTVTGTRPGDHPSVRMGTDGPPMHGSAVRILGPDGADVPSGVDGEVIVQGPDQFIGYRDSTINAEAFTPDGWLRTGDLGHLDEGGRLIITDRIKDVIIRGGETISSGQVEDVLAAHPSVAEAVAVAAPHPHYGEVVAAVVVLEPGRTITLDEIRLHFANSGLAKQKTPERLVVVDELPRTALGKVRKADLRKTYFG